MCILPARERMIKSFLLLVLLCSYFTGVSQTLTAESIYYDDKSKPYKIERKYTDGENTWFVQHLNSSSSCIQQEKSVQSDTVVIRDQYYSIKRPLTKLEKFAHCSMWVEVGTSQDESITFVGYAGDERVGDTTLVGDAAKRAWAFTSEIKSERVPHILAGKLNVSLDSLLFMEAIQTTIVDGLPVKIEHFDKTNKIDVCTTCELIENGIVCRQLDVKQPKEVMRSDSIVWNNSGQNLQWFETAPYLSVPAVTTYQMEKCKLIRTNTYGVREFEFLEDVNFIDNPISDGILRFDLLYSIQLHQHDGKNRVKETKTDQQAQTKEFVFDNDQRIIEEYHYFNGSFQRRVVYNYIDEDSERKMITVAGITTSFPTGEPIPLSIVEIWCNGEMIAATRSDFDGFFQLKIEADVIKRDNLQLKSYGLQHKMAIIEISPSQVKIVQLQMEVDPLKEIDQDFLENKALELFDDCGTED